MTATKAATKASFGHGGDAVSWAGHGVGSGLHASAWSNNAPATMHVQEYTVSIIPFRLFVYILCRRVVRNRWRRQMQVHRFLHITISLQLLDRHLPLFLIHHGGLAALTLPTFPLHLGGPALWGNNEVAHFCCFLLFLSLKNGGRGVEEPREKVVGVAGKIGCTQRLACENGFLSCRFHAAMFSRLSRKKSTITTRVFGKHLHDAAIFRISAPSSMVRTGIAAFSFRRKS